MRNQARNDLEGAVLESLSVHDVDAETASRIRTLAHTILARRRERGARRFRIERAYTRIVEPALVSGVVMLYLMWAVKRVLLLYQVLQS